MARGGAETSSAAAPSRTSDTLPGLIASLFSGRKVDGLVVGDSRSLNGDVFDRLVRSLGQTLLVRRGDHEEDLEEKYRPRLRLLRSLAAAAPDSLDVVVSCPVLGQIVPTLTELAPGQMWRALRPGGYLITFGVSLRDGAHPHGAETRAYFERYLSAASRDMPPALAAKYEFVEAQPRTPGGKSYVTWLVLRKKGALQSAAANAAAALGPASADSSGEPAPPPAEPLAAQEASAPEGADNIELVDKPESVDKLHGIAFLRGSETIDNLVFSIVPNSCVSDARVLRHARALTNAGWRVRVYCAAQDGLPAEEIVDGVEFRRFAGFHSDTALASEVEAAALDGFGPYRGFMQERLQLFRQGARLGELMTAENQRLRAALKSADDGRERRLLRDGVNEFAAIFREAIPHFRARNRQDFQKLRYFFFAANFLGQAFDARPKIIHAHDLASLPGAIQLAKATGAKLVFDAHEIETERAPPLPADQKKFIDGVESWWLEHCDRIVTVCDSAADFYAARFAGERPTVVMNVPEAPDPAEAAGFDLRRHAGLPADAKVAVYTGALGREPRGLDKVVAALGLLPALHLVILGPRHPGNDAWLLGIAEALGVRERVSLLAPVEANRVVDAIQSADVGVCPIQDAALSYRISMPNKLFECAFAGVPICVSDLPEMAKFVTSLGIGVVMDQTDPRAIAAALDRVLQDRRRYMLSADARRRLMTEYSWDVQAARMLRLYGEVLAPANGAEPGSDAGADALDRPASDPPENDAPAIGIGMRIRGLRRKFSPSGPTGPGTPEFPAG